MIKTKTVKVEGRLVTGIDNLYYTSDIVVPFNDGIIVNVTPKTEYAKVVAFEDYQFTAKIGSLTPTFPVKRTQKLDAGLPCAANNISYNHNILSTSYYKPSFNIERVTARNTDADGNIVFQKDVGYRIIYGVLDLNLVTEQDTLYLFSNYEDSDLALCYINTQLTAYYVEPQGTWTVTYNTDIVSAEYEIEYAERDDTAEYLILFNTNGGTDVAMQSVSYGDKVVRPPNPQKAGYVFAGWYSDIELTEQYNFNKSVYKDMILYAKWQWGATPPSTEPTIIDTVHGSIFGTGDTPTRKNEITGDNLAVFRDFLFGYKDGVIQDQSQDFETHAFGYSVNKNNVQITDGLCFAYGYVAYCGAKSFDILFPAVENYFIIFARINRSVVPNTAELLIKNNYSSSNIGINTFRQDVLTTVKTGVYEIPLWIFKATNKGIVTPFKDLRPMRDCIMKCEFANITTAQVIKEIENGATATTQPITDNSKKVATTAFTQTAIKAEIDK